MQKTEYKHFFLLVFPVAIAVLVYIPTIWFDYVWDDFHLFLESAMLRGSVDLWHAISAPILPGTTYFRPLVMLTFYFEFYGAEPNPIVSHSINVGLHALNVLLVCLLVYKYHNIKEGQASICVALLAGVFYGMHPALTESASWVAARFDLLATSFYLLALISGLGSANKSAIATAFFLLASLLCKEMAITFPAVFVLIKLSLSLPRNYGEISAWVKKERVFLVAIISSLVIYVFLRYMFLINIYHVNLSLTNSLKLIERVDLVGQSLWFYLGRIIWPFFTTNPIYPLEKHSAEVFGVSVVFMALVLGFSSMSMKSKSLLLILAVIASLSPVLNLVPLTIGGNVGHDRFLTLPLALFSLIIPDLYKIKISWLQSFVWSVRIVIVLFILLSTFVVHQNINFWRDNTALWSWAYSVNPDSNYARNNLVSSILNGDGDLLYAKSILEQGNGEVDRDAGKRSRMIMIDYRLGRIDEALISVDQILKEKDPPHLKLADVGVDWRQAKAPPREIFVDVDIYKFLYSMKSELSLKKGWYQEAEAAALTSIFYQADNCRSRHMLSFAQRMQGKIQEAEVNYNNAIRVCTKMQSENIEAKLKDLAIPK